MNLGNSPFLCVGYNRVWTTDIHRFQPMIRVTECDAP